MTFDVSPVARRLWRIARFAVLVAVSVVAGHTAVYAAHRGVGEELAAAMSSGGHDAYWPLALAGTIGIGALALARAGHGVWRMWREARRIGRRHEDFQRGSEPSERPYRRELLAIWPALFAVTAAAYLGLENLEHLAAHSHLTGLEALFGADHPLAVPILAGVSLAVAGIGALIRWRVRVLEARLRAAATRRPPPDHERVRPAGLRWQSFSAQGAHRLVLVRARHGRAPPHAPPRLQPLAAA